MKIAYLIFAYNNPNHQKKLIGALTSQDCGFFIHIDKKSDFSDFKRIKGDNIFFCDNRIPVYWGEFSGIQAILILIRQALNSTQKFEYFVLLSGSDYPLRSSEYIHRFFEINQGIEFMSIIKMPCEKAGKPISRINTYSVKSDKPVFQFVVKLLVKLGLAQRDYRKYLGDLEPYSGSTWWAITRDACMHLLDFVDKNRGVVRFFENTFCPEEMFFQTILGNSQFKARIRRNLMYTDWSARSSHPVMITEKHISYFENHDKVMAHDVYGDGELLFARKFSDNSLELVNRINKLIA